MGISITAKINTNKVFAGKGVFLKGLETMLILVCLAYCEKMNQNLYQQGLLL